MTSGLIPHHHLFDGAIPNVPTARQLHEVVAALVSATGLHAICPVAVSVRTPDWSAFVMIAESHVSLHGKGKEAWVDVFSCRPFDVQLIYRLLSDGLGGQWDHKDTERGKRRASDAA